MFTDGRSKKVIFIAHCILNQNAISDGTADFSNLNKEVTEFLIKKDVGIIQMPCPELCCLGLDRGNILGAESEVVAENTRIRREISKSPAIDKLMFLVDYVILQIKEYIKNDFHVMGIIGSNRSPSCGVETTSDNNKEIEGQGVFIEKLREALNKEKISIKFIGIKANENPIEKIKKIL